MQLIVVASIAGAVICLGFVLWFIYAMRSLVVHEKKELAYNVLESRINIESRERHSLDRIVADLDRLIADHAGNIRNINNNISDMSLRLDAYAAKHEGLRTEHERRLDELADRSAPDVALLGELTKLNERCDKNSQAITNTAESMQKLLNEKFTALKLALTGK